MTLVKVAFCRILGIQNENMIASFRLAWKSQSSPQFALAHQLFCANLGSMPIEGSGVSAEASADADDEADPAMTEAQKEALSNLANMRESWAPGDDK